MDHPPNPAEEAVESVNPGDQGLPASDPFESVRSERVTPLLLVDQTTYHFCDKCVQGFVGIVVTIS